MTDRPDNGGDATAIPRAAAPEGGSESGLESDLADVDVLRRLGATLAARRGAEAGSSYVASLYDRGVDTILGKIGEESIELILAGKGDDDAHVIAEAADVWFHTLVLLSYRGLGPDDILRELARREGVSGHAEKAARAVTRGEQPS